MPNTYTQLYVHVIFAVKARRLLISNLWKDNLYKYITGIITNKNQKLMIINGMPDHLHLLIGLKPDCALSDLVRDVKANSSKWINENKFVQSKFEWQSGFGAFSVSKSGLNAVANYIECWTEAILGDTVLKVLCSGVKPVNGMYSYLMPVVNGKAQKTKGKKKEKWKRSRKGGK